MVVVRDFNCVIGSKDKRGGGPFVEDTGFREFLNFLQSNGLVDLEFVGYIWCNNRLEGARV